MIFLLNWDIILKINYQPQCIEREVLMLKYLKVFMVILFYHIPIFSHCQIPCGIYSDAMQIVQIKEDLQTIEKAINMINMLSAKADPQSLNQINRWINTKEDHAQNDFYYTTC